MIYLPPSKILVTLRCKTRSDIYHVAMKERIRHRGIIESIEGSCVRVRVSQEAACATCHAAGRCNAAGNKERIIDVRGVAHPASLTVGDAVVVSATASSARLSLLIAFVLPLALAIGALTATIGVTGNDTLAATMSLVVIAAYYAAVYMARKWIGDKVGTFEIEMESGQ